MGQDIGVAISTTGQEHRIGTFVWGVRAWRETLPDAATVVVTVDGNIEDQHRVLRALRDAEVEGVEVYRLNDGFEPARAGVAASKNTGIEILTDAGVEHLFLSDDDAWPMNGFAINKHIELATGHGVLHSMVCWGSSRLEKREGYWASWTWPRGVVLYAHRSVIETVGGMVEEFGSGGHEHAEWSRRIHANGLTPAPFVSPRSYAEHGPGGRATRASVLWACADMRRPGESAADFVVRKYDFTTLHRNGEESARINALLDSLEGSTAFVPYKASENGRPSATLCFSLTSRGAEGDDQA